MEPDSPLFKIQGSWNLRKKGERWGGCLVCRPSIRFTRRVRGSPLYPVSPQPLPQTCVGVCQFWAKGFGVLTPQISFPNMGVGQIRPPI
jgi:hypothetical protein